MNETHGMLNCFFMYLHYICGRKLLLSILHYILFCFSLQNLFETQFDCHPKFKEKVNDISAVELRTNPIGRDRNGLAYWYLVVCVSVHSSDIENNDFCKACII